MNRISKAVLLGLLLVAIMPPQVSAIGENWLTGWDYRQAYTITGSSFAGQDYQVFINVTYDSNMQSDFDDLRFTDDNGASLLDYWIEDYTASTFADVWIEVKDNLNTEQVIFMYYGNGAVSTTSNGENTFIFFDDFEYSGSPDPTKWLQVGSENDITCNGYDLVLTGTVGVQEGYGGLWGTDSVNTTLHYRGNSTSTNTVGHEYGLFDVDDLGNYSNDTIYIFGNINANYATLYTRNNATPASDGDDSPYPKTSDLVWSYNWYENSTSRYVDVYQGDSLAYSQNGASIPDGDIELAPYFGNGVNTYYVHYVFVAKYVVSEPVVIIGAWQEIAELRLYFPVPFHEWGMNTALVILGLVMIPVSTLYLAYGIKHDRSSDRLFYGLIILMLGFGMFIGGILP